MRVLIITYGSRGDVQPYIALGRELSRAGHHVTLATSERFREFVTSHRLDYGYMSDDLLAIIDTPQGKELLENTTNVFQVIWQNIKLSRQVKPLTAALMRESWEVAQHVRPDYIIYHPKAGAAPHIAEKQKIGCALATPIPMFVPTSEFPFPVLPDFRIGGWYNRLSYRIINSLSNWFLGPFAKDFRNEIGLPPLKAFNVLKASDGSDISVLHAHSQAVVPRPTDWPQSAFVTGYWFLDEETDWECPGPLLDFLNAGAPPIYVGFGSVTGRNPERLAKVVVEAIQMTGLRGVIATGWGGLKTEHLPSSIHKIEGAPHDWLFPRMAAVVHHGGAGTTAAGLRAGKPTVVVPFFGDQPFWGKRIHELGAGPKPIPHKKLTANRLSTALLEATSNREMIETAQLVGRAIRSEDGVSNAVEIVQKLACDREAADGL
ncbi:MAG: glycosyltransferase [Pseudomonadota bacterium]